MDRRRFLALAGTGLATLAGCLDGGSNGEAGDPTATEQAPAATPDDTPTETPEKTPTTDREASLTTPNPRLFTGDERVFVVNGYSTSFDWPDIFQRKLDRRAGGESPIRVEKALKPGTPIVQWLDPDTGDPKQPWQEILAPALQQDAPVIALAQQSLQGRWGEFHEGIRGENDTERIEEGADLLELYSDRLQADGADHVFVATHIYKEPLEPTIGNERLALAAFLDRGPDGVTAGPDVWGPTSKRWPEAFQDDEVHPNDAGAEIMAHHWFRQLLRADGRDVPEWSKQEMTDAIDSVN